MLFRDNSGWIYSANNEGLLLYDGHEWELFPTGALRVLLKGKDGRLYAGSYNKFGYYETGPDGHPWFKTLSDSIHVSINNFSDIWDIYQIKNDYYFISYYCCCQLLLIPFLYTSDLILKKKMGSITLLPQAYILRLFVLKIIFIAFI